MVIITMTYAQSPTVTIMNLKVNNMSLSSGATINMGTDSSVNLKFRVDLEKDTAYHVEQLVYKKYT